MITVATEKDFRSIEVQEFEIGDVSIEDILSSEYMNGHVYCVREGEDVIACGGVYSFWDGRAETWVAVSKIGLKYPKTLFKDVKKIVDTYSKFVNRLEAVVKCDYAPSANFIKHLGFELETPRMKKYGMKGDDYAMYVRIK